MALPTNMVSIFAMAYLALMAACMTRLPQSALSCASGLMMMTSAIAMSGISNAIYRVVALAWEYGSMSAAVRKPLDLTTARKLF